MPLDVTAPGVKFTNILCAAFTRKDSKSKKKDSPVKQFFALLGSARVKAAHNHVDEIYPCCNIQMILRDKTIINGRTVGHCIRFGRI